MPRKGAASRVGIAADVLADLNAGRTQAGTFAECLAVDHATLLAHVVPDLPVDRIDDLRAMHKAGITRKMAACAEVLLGHLGPAAVDRLAGHPSDTVRGWAAFMVGRVPGLALADRLARVRRFADDSHFGVREWAWLAVRPHVVEDVREAIRLLAPWTGDASANVRRFASEATRPRGVWATHIPDLKRDPDLGLPILEPLRSDDARYVQDSVANWVNDASKDRPDWARALCDRWSKESGSPVTTRIVKRAMRSPSI